ncbi:MAG: hypothetical protein K9M17_07960 [Mariprofundaceae bacterium]|nr:hypothetical protein [Mariprofundaceae bacterium]
MHTNLVPITFVAAWGSEEIYGKDPLTRFNGQKRAAARDNIVLNVGGMGIAAGITYSGLMANNPTPASLMVTGND